MLHFCHELLIRGVFLFFSLDFIRLRSCPLFLLCLDFYEFEDSNVGAEFSHIHFMHAFHFRT